MIRTHPHHSRAVPVLKQVQQGQLEGVISAHSLAECYSVITGFPRPHRLSPAKTWQLLQQDVLAFMPVFALAADDYRDILQHLVKNGLAGGVTYDAVIAWVAMQTQVDQIITFNTRDFRRVVPTLTAQVITP